MIGNDLVYFPDWKRRSGDRLRRFRQKIYTPRERIWIENDSDHHLLEAKFWAVKEAVYKSAFKKLRERKFAPKSIAIVDYDGIHFSVIHREEQYLVTVEVAKDFVHAVTSPGVGHLSFSFEDDSHYRSKITVEESAMKLVKDNFGVPHGFWKNRKLDLSVSHDGGMAVVDVSF